MLNLFRNRWITLYSGMDGDKFSKLTYTLRRNGFKYREKVIDAAAIRERGASFDEDGNLVAGEDYNSLKPGYVVQVPYRTAETARKSAGKFAL